MSRDSLHVAGAIATGLAITIVGGWLLVVPQLREASTLRAEATELRSRTEGVGDLSAVREERTAERDRERARCAIGMKRIPAEPDVAGLMRRLSLPVDGVGVRDQTFTAGVPRPAIEDRRTPERSGGSGLDAAEQALPLTVDLVARFDSVFALLRSAERLPRLVRVRAIRMAVAEQRSDDEPVDGSPMVSATVDLEVIYDPTGGAGIGPATGRPAP